jgi:4-hydroxy-2-oxoheptanedioate aldolase
MGLRADLHSGAPLVGAWLQLGSPVTAELVVRSGAGWAGIDTEHGAISHHEMAAMLQVLRLGGVPALVRVAGNDHGEIGRALDAGACGVIVPQVESRAEAERAVAACRYPPAGRRSWGPLQVALAEGDWTPQDGDDHAACIVMLESEAAVHGAEDIVSTPGLDAVLLGPNDLALTIGLPPTATFQGGRHRDLVDEAIRACREADVPVGAVLADPADARAYVDMGIRLLAVFGDLRTLARESRAAMRTARRALSGE